MTWKPVISAVGRSRDCRLAAILPTRASVVGWSLLFPALKVSARVLVPMLQPKHGVFVSVFSPVSFVPCNYYSESKRFLLCL